MYYNNILRLEDWREDKILEQIKETNPELISIVEKSYWFEDYLLNNWYIRVWWTRNTECNTYTKEENKEKVEESEVIQTKSNYDICYTKYDWKDIFVVHPHPPKNKEQFLRWRDFMNELSEIILKNKRDYKIIVWDFNATIYNSHFKNNFEDLYQYSYYTWNSLNKYLSFFVTLPIDHILSNKEINFFPLEYTNSDHRALLLKK